MVISASDLIFYAAANRPLDDVSLVGGAIDIKTKILTTSIFANEVEVLSSSASDTQSLYLYGRAKNGRKGIRVIQLNGTTVVADPFYFDQIFDIQLSSDAIGTVTIRKASTDVTFVTISAGSRGHTSLFKYSYASEGQTFTRYDKMFAKNTSGADSLYDASVLLIDESGNLTFGLDTSVNGNTSAANRKTAPSGITFYDLDTIVDVPGTDLASTARIGIWIKQVLRRRELPSNSDLVAAIAGATS